MYMDRRRASVVYVGAHRRYYFVVLGAHAFVAVAAATLIRGCHPVTIVCFAVPGIITSELRRWGQHRADTLNSAY